MDVLIVRYTAIPRLGHLVGVVGLTGILAGSGYKAALEKHARQEIATYVHAIRFVDDIGTMKDAVKGALPSTETRNAQTLGRKRAADFVQVYRETR